MCVFVRWGWRFLSVCVEGGDARVKTGRVESIMLKYCQELIRANVVKAVFVTVCVQVWLHVSVSLDVCLSLSFFFSLSLFSYLL